VRKATGSSGIPDVQEQIERGAETLAERKAILDDDHAAYPELEIESSPEVVVPPLELVPELCDPGTGRLDAKRISAVFGLPVSSIAEMLGWDPALLQKHPQGLVVQPGLAIFARIAVPLLRLAGSPEAMSAWMRTPCPDLAGATPLSFLQAGKGETVAELLEDALVGQPG
jgi:hypothetical protein